MLVGGVLGVLWGVHLGKASLWLLDVLGLPTPITPVPSRHGWPVV
jgi:hypothetical protein